MIGNSQTFNVNAVLTGSGIYAITHRETGRQYIGSAASFTSRLGVHLWELSNNRHHCKKLQNTVNKYGFDSFDFDIIEYVDGIQHLIPKEQLWLDFFKPFFNIRKIAESNRGIKHSLETKALHSILAKARYEALSPEQKESLKERGRLAALARKGIPREESFRIHMREINIGKKRSPEQCAAISASKKAGKHSSHEHMMKMASVNKGKPRSEEVKAKIRAAHLARWEKKL